MPFQFPRRSAARGFTLLELLVVMVIIGLLAGYVGPKFFGQIGKSEVKAAKAQIDALQKALDQYRLDVGRYPSLGINPATGAWAIAYEATGVGAFKYAQRSGSDVNRTARTSTSCSRTPTSRCTRPSAPAAIARASSCVR